MRPSRVAGALCLLFFLLMAAATGISVHRDWESLPRVALAAAREEAPGQYRVPLSALAAGPEGRVCLCLVLEEEGPWGKEYRCRQVPVGVISRDSARGTALVTGRQLDRAPVAIPGGEAPGDGARVRLMEG